MVIDIGKFDSYFDWELRYNSKPKKKEDSINSIGIPEKLFKKIVEKWKKKNLEQENDK